MRRVSGWEEGVGFSCPLCRLAKDGLPRWWLQGGGDGGMAWEGHASEILGLPSAVQLPLLCSFLA